MTLNIHLQVQKKKKKVWISFSYYTDLKNPNIMYVFTAHIICCLLSWITHINLSLLLTWSTFFCFRPQWTLFLVPVAPSFFFLSFLKLFFVPVVSLSALMCTHVSCITNWNLASYTNLTSFLHISFSFLVFLLLELYVVLNILLEL